MNQAEAKFIVPDWGDKVNSGFAGGYDNPIWRNGGVNIYSISPSQGLWI